MSKKKTLKDASAQNRRQVANGIEPVALLEMLDLHYTDNGGEGGSSYRRLYRQAREAALKDGGEGAVSFAALLESVDANVPVEEATRRAGFIVGFNVCRQLLLGEMDLEALKHGDAE